MEEQSITPYEVRIKQGDRALNEKRQIEEARSHYKAALELVDPKDTVRRIDTEQKVAFCTSMLGEHQAALEIFNKLEEKAEELDSPKLRSSALRDYVLAIHRDPHGDTQLAHEKLDIAFELNDTDNNRYALTGVRGRLFSKEGRYEDAYASHREADLGWSTLQEQGHQESSTEQWQFNNLAAYFEAALATGRFEKADELEWRARSDEERFTATHSEKFAKLREQYPSV